MATTKTDPLTTEERGPQWLNSAGIHERVVVRLRLMLKTPTHVGSGDDQGLIDMPLMRSSDDGKPMISGATLAGALRAYLASQDKEAAAQRLFGSVHSDSKSRESWVQVSDARLIEEKGRSTRTEIRDGVGINSLTRTASPRLKYDLELLEAGCIFETTLTLLIPKNHSEFYEHFLCSIAGLNGSIRLGKRKRRGFGQCSIQQARQWRYTFPKDLLRWLEKPLSEAQGEYSDLDLAKLQPKNQAGSSNDCFVELKCQLASPLVVRAAPREVKEGVKNLSDQEMIRSRRNGEVCMVLPGTSLAGAMRARCERIANTLYPGSGKLWAEHLFGKGREANEQTASRLWVDETVIEEPNEWIHTRVKIDRFTGGAYPGALFSEGLLLPSEKTKLKIHLRLQDAKRAEIGMLLLLLKDLWTGDLTVGGEAGVGRGRLKGLEATIRWNGKEWTLHPQGEHGLHVTTTEKGDDLNQFVKEVGAEP